MLTKSQAEKLVLARLKSRFESAHLSIADADSIGAIVRLGISRQR